MWRRTFLTLIGAVAASRLLTAYAAGTPARVVGVFIGYAEDDPVAQADIAAFRGALATWGWTEGSNLRIELRWAAGDAEKVRKFAKELVDLGPDVILGHTTSLVGALTAETKAIPIVFVNVGDPVADHFVTTIAHPDTNITSFMLDISAQGGKWVEVLKELAPDLKQIALLSNPATGPSLQLFMPSIQAAASAFAIEVRAAPVQAKDELEKVFVRQAQVTGGGGVIVIPATFNTVNRDLIVALADRYKVPTIYNNPVFVESGGLVAYGTDYIEQFRQAAGYVDRMLRGARPADLPVQAPTKFELFINLKTAKALGLEVEPSLLARADRVIE